MIAFGHLTWQNWAFRALSALRTQVSQHFGLRFSCKSPGQHDVSYLYANGACIMHTHTVFETRKATKWCRLSVTQPRRVLPCINSSLRRYLMGRRIDDIQEIGDIAQNWTDSRARVLELAHCAEYQMQTAITHGDGRTHELGHYILKHMEHVRGPDQIVVVNSATVVSLSDRLSVGLSRSSNNPLMKLSLGSAYNSHTKDADVQPRSVPSRPKTPYGCL